MRTISGKTHDSRRTEASLATRLFVVSEPKKEQLNLFLDVDFFLKSPPPPTVQRLLSTRRGRERERGRRLGIRLREDNAPDGRRRRRPPRAEAPPQLPRRRRLDPRPLEARGRREEEEGGAREEETVFSRAPFVGREVRGDKGAGGDASRDLGSRLIRLGRCFSRRRK
jgi:hypothetical protein